MISFDTFKNNLETVRQAIEQACHAAGRTAKTVQILPVTKRHPIDAIRYAIRTGLPAIGENRVQESSRKKSLLPTGVRWELIGHLQSNKAKEAVTLFDRIQSVDSLKLIRHLNRHAGQAETCLPILIECNTGNDPNKFGFSVEAMESALEAGLESENLQVDGLMTIAPLSNDEDVAKAAFEKLRNLRDRLETIFGVVLPELSMGMTGDLKAAIAAGSTQVRIGTALFGQRPERSEY